MIVFENMFSLQHRQSWNTNAKMIWLRWQSLTNLIPRTYLYCVNRSCFVYHWFLIYLSFLFDSVSGTVFILNKDSGLEGQFVAHQSKILAMEWLPSHINQGYSEWFLTFFFIVFRTSSVTTMMYSIPMITNAHHNNFCYNLSKNVKKISFQPTFSPPPFFFTTKTCIIRSLPSLSDAHVSFMKIDI